MSSIGGRLGELRPYWLKILPFHIKSHFREKIRYFPLKEFLSLVLSKNAIMLQHYIMKFSLCYQSSVRLREVKNKRKIQTFSSKNGHSRLQEVVVAFASVENSSLRRGGRCFW